MLDFLKTNEEQTLLLALGIGCVALLLWGIRAGKTFGRYGNRVYKAESPILFWLTIVTQFLVAGFIIVISISSMHQI